MATIGCAEADITPWVKGQNHPEKPRTGAFEAERPLDLSGFLLRQNPAEGVSDPLKVRWISLRDGAGHQALVGSADVLSFSRGAFQTLRSDIRERLGTPELPVGLATTHTHSGPATVLLRHCGRMNPPYLAHLKAQIVECAARAATGQNPVARLRIGRIPAPFNLNRRHENTGPLDQDLVVFAFDDAAGKPLALLVNYACHPVVLGHENRLVSADYPGFLCRFLEQATGAAALFFNGACGDINPREAHLSDPGAARDLGEKLGHLALTALAEAEHYPVGEIRWHRRRVSIPTRIPADLREIEARLRELEERFGVSGSLFEGRLERDHRLLASGRYPKEIAIELSLLTLGDRAGILFVPGELFASLGLAAKALAADRQLMISGFSNGSVGYLCDRQAFTDGGYEPHFANFFYDCPEFLPDVEDRLRAAFADLLNAAHP